MMSRLVQAWTQQLLGALRGPDMHFCMQAQCPLLPAAPVLAPDQPLIQGVVA